MRFLKFGAFGNFGRNTLRGPAAYNMDFSLCKSIPINEPFKVQLRIEAFNVLNIQNRDSRQWRSDAQH